MKILFSVLYRPKVILWIGITIIVAMCLFPPFVTDSKIDIDNKDYDGGIGKYVRGYAFLFSNEIPKKSREHYGNYEAYRDNAFVPAHIDLVRLIIQCAIVGLITGALLYTLKDKKS